MLPGLILRGLASGHVQKDKQLTTSGPYAHTRNPLYLGSLLLAVGFAIAARSWWVVAVMLMTLILIYVPVVAAEERSSAARFPNITIMRATFRGCFRASLRMAVRGMPILRNATGSITNTKQASDVL